MRGLPKPTLQIFSGILEVIRNLEEIRSLAKKKGKLNRVYRVTVKPNRMFEGDIGLDFLFHFYTFFRPEQIEKL